MAQIKKTAAFLEQLHSMVTKEATAGKATGKPGGDTHPESVSEKTDHVNKNEEGRPEHNPQEFKQEKAKDPSDPSKTHKSAEEAAAAEKTAEAEKTAAKANIVSNGKPEVAAEAPNSMSQKEHGTKEVKIASEAPTNEKLAELGKQLLEAIGTLNKEGTAGKATGKPGGDTNPVSVSEKTDHVNKNEEGRPEHNPQEFKQEKAKDPSDPTKAHHKSAETELDKQASYELGRQFARTFLTSKTASSVDLYKEAGRKDFETLIAQAASELETEQPAVQPTKVAEVTNTKVAEDQEAAQIKQAEEAGALAFQTMVKQAEAEERANQVKVAFEQRINQLSAEKIAAEKHASELTAKVAAHEATLQKQAEDAKLDAKFAAWGSRVVDEVINRLKDEPTR